MRKQVLVIVISFILAICGLLLFFTPLSEPPTATGPQCLQDYHDEHTGIVVYQKDWQEMSSKKEFDIGPGAKAFFVPTQVKDGPEGWGVEYWYEAGGEKTKPEFQLFNDGDIYPTTIAGPYKGQMISYGPIFLLRCDRKIFFIDRNIMNSPIKPPGDRHRAT